MKMNNEYMSFLEAHRQTVEMNDKLKRATKKYVDQKIAQSLK